MRSLFLSTMLVLASGIAGAGAQSPAGSGTNCQALLGDFGVSLGQEVRTRDRPNGCVITNGALDTARYQTWTFTRAEIKAENFASIRKDNVVIPAWGSIAVEGLIPRFRTGNPLASYITKLQQWPMEFAASYRWHAADGRLEVDDVRLSSIRGGVMSVSADLTADRNTTPQALAATGNIGISRLRVRLDNQGLFEALVGPSAVALAAYFSVPDGETGDIEARIEEAKAKAVALLAAAPDTQLDKDSKQALIRFVQDMPHPTGYFSVEIELPKPLTISDLAPGMDDLKPARILAGARIEARYSAR